MEELERKIKALKLGRTLDVATGQGAFVEAITRDFGGYDRVTAIDINAAYGAAVRANFADVNVAFAAMDAAAMAFPDDTFDSACLSCSLHHMADEAAVLAEMKRVVRPGGLVIIHEMYADAADARRRTHVLLHAWWAKVDRLRGITHKATYQEKDLRAFVAATALADVDIIAYAEPLAAADETYVRAHVDTVDACLAKARGLPEYAELEREGAVLKDRLATVGIAPPPALFIVGRKPG